MTTIYPRYNVYALYALLIMPILYGTCVKFLWEWFIVPFGIVPITIPWAIGLSALASLLLPNTLNKKNQDDDLNTLYSVSYDLVKIVFITLIGFIAHLCM